MVPFEAYCASTVDPLSGLVTRSLAEEMGGAEEAEIFFERLYFEHDLTQLTKMARDRHPVALLSETAGGRLERSARHRELLGPLGLAHEMRVVFATGGSMWGSMDLIREKGRPDFESRHVTLLRRLPSGRRAPHGGALRADGRGARWRRPAGRPDPGPWRAGRAAHPCRRTLAEGHRRAGTRLAGVGRAPPGGPHGLRRARTGALPGVGRGSRSAPARARTLTLYGSRTGATSERPAETVIVVEPAKPEEVAWLNVASYGLSAREHEVIQLSTNR